MSLNNPVLWNSNSLDHAFELVGGPNKDQHLPEAIWVAKKLSQSIQNNWNVLEVGCGFGRILKELHSVLKEGKKNVKLVGVDFNKQMIDTAIEYTKSTNINFFLCENKIPLPDNSIDFIYTHAVLIHNNEEQVNKLFAEFGRILKKTGLMHHDFVNGDNEKGIEASKSALNKNFPLYAYNKKQINGIAEKYGFKLSNCDLANKSGERICYFFRK